MVDLYPQTERFVKIFEPSTSRFAQAMQGLGFTVTPLPESLSLGTDLYYPTAYTFYDHHLMGLLSQFTPQNIAMELTLGFGVHGHAFLPGEFTLNIPRHGITVGTDILQLGDLANGHIVSLPHNLVLGVLDLQHSTEFTELSRSGQILHLCISNVQTGQTPVVLGFDYSSGASFWANYLGY